MSHPSTPTPRPRLLTRPYDLPAALRGALAHSGDRGVRVPSDPSSRPWRIEVQADRLAVRADRPRQPTAFDTAIRRVVLGVGAAVFDLRVALADQGWASEVDRLPDPGDMDLLAEVRPVPGDPDQGLVSLAAWPVHRRTDSRRFAGAHLPDEILRRLTVIAEQEGVLLVSVVQDTHRRLVAGLIRQADRLQGAEPVATAGSDSGDDQSYVLLATRSDDLLSWLHVGESLRHVLLELARLGWGAQPVARPVEVPLTRTQLRSALTWDAHPQMLLRTGPGARTGRTPGRQPGVLRPGGRGPAEPDGALDRAPSS